MNSYTGKLKGMILYPCCPKEKAMVYENTSGFASYKCPNCGNFAVFDFDSMTAIQKGPQRGATHRFSKNNTKSLSQ